MAFDVRRLMQTSTTPVPATGAAAPSRPRLGVVDAFRGIAIIAVVGYHLVWDLGSLGIIDTRPAQTDAGRAVAHGIAGSFVFLVGVSLVLAHGDGLRRRAFARRLAELVGYGLLVSVVTFLLMPATWVSFGILQCLAVVSVLSLPFLWLSRAVAIGVAIAAVALPGLLSIPGDSRWWSWTGLTESVAPTIDNAPVLPMFALALAGIVLTRTLRERGHLERLARVPADRGPLRGLAFLGRHTLVIYLLHQPVLLGVLHAYRWVS